MLRHVHVTILAWSFYALASPCAATDDDVDHVMLLQTHAERSAANISRLPRAGGACEQLFEKHAANLAVLPDEGLIVCGNAKVGTSSLVSLLSRGLSGGAAPHPPKHAVKIASAHAEPVHASRKPAKSKRKMAAPDAETVHGRWNAESRGRWNGPGANLLEDEFSETQDEMLQTTDIVHRVRAEVQSKERILEATELDAKARHALCASKRIVSFTAVRNPWERLVSAYLGKILVHPDTVASDMASIRQKYNKKASAIITFSEFVRWVGDQPDEGINSHWEPQSVRCGAGEGLYSIESRIETSFEHDVQRMLSSIGWDQGLYAQEHISSVRSCLDKPPCVKAMEAQIGSRATWQGDSSKTLSRKLYAADKGHDLVAMVRKRYHDDCSSLGYTFP